MKKGLVVGLSVAALIGFCVALLYQVTHIDEPVPKKSLVRKRTNIVDFVKDAIDYETIPDEGIPLSGDIETEDPGDGYTINKSNKNAQKEIESSDISSFYCAFSTLYDEDPLTMGNKQWKLRADYDGKTVRGSYIAFDYTSTDERRFEADKSFMDNLWNIIEMYNLVSFNGLDNETMGISDEYGATLSVMFESGENIYASNNEENFLPIGAEDAFVQLFASACAKGSDLIGLSVSEKYENVTSGGLRGYVRFPLLHLGRKDAFGKIDELKYPVEEELRDAINRINSMEMDVAMEAKESFEKGHKNKELFYEGKAFVTRNDSEVISLYVRERSLWDPDQKSPTTGYRTYNVDSNTGEILKFTDAFRDLQKLTILIESSLEAKYPDRKFKTNSRECIKESILDNDGDVCFCLGNGFAHIFINENVVDDMPGGYHFSIPFRDNPKLISNFYVTYPKKTITKLDYDTDYYMDENMDFRMEYEADGDDIIWHGIAGGKTFDAPFYGYPPEVYMTSFADGNYLYLNVPTGDVSFHGIVYKITDRGLEVPEDNGDMGLSIISETTLDPDYLLMQVNEVIDGPVCFMYPTGAFRIDGDGFPVATAKEYKLTGGKLSIRESGRYNPRNTEDAAFSGGMYYVAEGTEVTPYASDLKNYIDFMTIGENESRIIRFVINEFSANMELDNFGGLGNVFK